MGKGRHVVIHDVIRDDNEMGNLWATDQSAIRTNFHAYFRQLPYCSALSAATVRRDSCQ